MSEILDLFVERAREVTIGEAAPRLGLALKGRAAEQAMPCPHCGGKDRFAINTAKNKWNCRGGSTGGNDAIGMAAHIRGLDVGRRPEFLEACGAVLGEAVPDGAEQLSEERRAEIRAEADARAEKAEREAAARAREAGEFREKELAKCRGIYEAATLGLGTSPAALYVKARTGLPMSRMALLGVAGFADRLTYWHGRDERGNPRDLWCGPALVLPFVDGEGHLIGIHQTWIDMDNGPKFRPHLVCPEKGETLPTKKMRGSKKGGLLPVAGEMSASRWVVGEGIENVCAWLAAELDDDDALARATFYAAAGDIGNLAGAAARTGRFAHPHEKQVDAKGVTRPVMMPSPIPDPVRISEGFPLGPHVRELLFLGDGDSERVWTEAHMSRAESRARLISPGIDVATRWPPSGHDWAEQALLGDIGDAIAASKSPDPFSGASLGDETGAENADSGDGKGNGEFSPGREPDRPSLGDLVASCAVLDHSDTDNAKRLLKHFGTDLLVVTQSKAKSPFYAVWTGTHWDTDNGGPRSLALAQQLGDLIMMEVEHINPTPGEQAAIDAGSQFLEKPDDELGKPQIKAKRLAEDANKAWMKRRAGRASFAVGSKNLAKMNAMLSCGAPHIMRDPDHFNADRYSFATLNHTIRFARETVAVPAQSDAEEDGEAVRAVVAVREGHARADLITQLVPVDYDPKARCPRWEAFLTRMLPDAEVRKLVQIAFALGLVGVTVQKLFFHYGSGANGKSVAMEVICRLLGSASVTLPATSFIGESNTGGSASPDIARLYGRRFLRVKELPQGEDLKENLVKEVTGGEAITARDLHQGYFDFDPLFTPHMSGNGYPRITGMDNGIWRRMCVIHWPVQLTVDEQRDFEDVMAEFEVEFPGILNWMIEGMRMFLEEGLVIPEAVARATQDYRDEMDPTAAFCAACVRPSPCDKLTAKDFYHAYVNYTVDQGGKPISLTRFGLIMKRKFEREEGRTNHYLGIVLVDVPGDSGDPQTAPPGHWDDIPPI